MPPWKGFCLLFAAPILTASTLPPSVLEPAGWAFASAGGVYAATPPYTWPDTNWTLTFSAARLSPWLPSKPLYVLQHLINSTPAWVYGVSVHDSVLCVSLPGFFEVGFDAITVTDQRRTYVVTVQSVGPGAWDVGVVTDDASQSRVLVNGWASPLNYSVPGSTMWLRDWSDRQSPAAVDSMRLFDSAVADPAVISALLSWPGVTWATAASPSNIPVEGSSIYNASVALRSSLVFEYLLTGDGGSDPLADSSGNELHLQLYSDFASGSGTTEAGNLIALQQESDVAAALSEGLFALPAPKPKDSTLQQRLRAESNASIAAASSSGGGGTLTFSTVTLITASSYAEWQPVALRVLPLASVSNATPPVLVAIQLSGAALPACGSLRLLPPSVPNAMIVSALPVDAVLVDGLLYTSYAPSLSAWGSGNFNGSGSGSALCVTSGFDSVLLELNTSGSGSSGYTSIPSLPANISVRWRRAAPPAVTPSVVLNVGVHSRFVISLVGLRCDSFTTSVCNSTSTTAAPASYTPTLVAQGDGSPLVCVVTSLPSSGLLFHYNDSWPAGGGVDGSAPLSVGDVAETCTVQWYYGAGEATLTHTSFNFSVINGWGLPNNVNGSDGDGGDGSSHTITMLLSLDRPPLPVISMGDGDSNYDTCQLDPSDPITHIATPFSLSRCSHACPPLAVSVPQGGGINITLPWYAHRPLPVNIDLEDFPAHGSLGQTLQAGAAVRALSSLIQTAQTTTTSLTTTATSGSLWASSVHSVEVSGWGGEVMCSYSSSSASSSSAFDSLCEGGGRNGAGQALGKPNAWPIYGDSESAFSTWGSGNASITIGVDSALYITRVSIFESWYPGYVTSVEANRLEYGSDGMTESGEPVFETLWYGPVRQPAVSATARIFEPPLCAPPFPSTLVRINITGPGAIGGVFPEIDAILVSGQLLLDSSMLAREGGYDYNYTVSYTPVPFFHGHDSLVFSTTDCRAQSTTRDAELTCRAVDITVVEQPAVPTIARVMTLDPLSDAAALLINACNDFSIYGTNLSCTAGGACALGSANIPLSSTWEDALPGLTSW